jgi:hypothetical protein
MADSGEPPMSYKLLSLLAAVAAAFAARHAISFAWRSATGAQPPANPEHPDVTWGEAVTWSVVSGAVVGIARLVAQRKVAASWHKATGGLPGDVRESSA